MNFKMSIKKDDLLSPESPALRLLAALRAAGCAVWLEPEPDDPHDRKQDVLIVSPPARRVAWDADVEAAIDHYYGELRDLVGMERT